MSAPCWGVDSTAEPHPWPGPGTARSTGCSVRGVVPPQRDDVRRILEEEIGFMASDLMFDAERLRQLADENSEQYRNNHPFPHIQIDGLLPEEVLRGIINEFPGPGDIEWKDKTHQYSRKAACEDLSRMGPVTRDLIMQMNCGVFVDFLERLTGISGIVADPHLAGGGLHQIRPGGFLDIHADFNVHPRLELERRLNALLFLNDDWREDYGGHLELWRTDMKKCEARILPVANRLVIFNTTDTAFHGHPEPLRCPANRTRNSIAMYYYTRDRPGQEKTKPHSTLYKGELQNWKNRIRRSLWNWA